MVLGALFIPRVQFGTAELVVQVLVGGAVFAVADGRMRPHIQSCGMEEGHIGTHQ
jgi:hypothetical protein